MFFNKVALRNRALAQEKLKNYEVCTDAPTETINLSLLVE